MIEALDIRVRGIVQGVGFRPFVYRLARRHIINGWVLNDLDGVFIHAEGEGKLLDEFVTELHMNPPAAAVVREVELKEVPLQDCTAFEIRESQAHDAEEGTLVSADLGMCDDCRRELFDPADRRYRYPFINCTNCGPRFTIIDSLPYDRPATSMASFEMCDDCAREYADPGDRRFHAQPDACFECGPQLSYIALTERAASPGSPEDCDARLPARAASPGGSEGLETPRSATSPENGGIAVPDGFASGSGAALFNPMSEEISVQRVSQPSNPPGEAARAESRASQSSGLPGEASLPEKGRRWSDWALSRCVELLADGGIVAVKGLGGFHLVCDARNPGAIAELRRRKRRDGKAFAVMVADVEAARAVCEVSAEEAALLESAARPIVLLRKRADAQLAEGLADRLPELGVTLPATPVQALLIHDFAQGNRDAMLVMTSGNAHDEPIVTDDAEACGKLAGIADAVLGNNRPILSRYDDSVVRVIDLGGTDAQGRPNVAVQVIRRARGYAPVPVKAGGRGQEPGGDASVFAAGSEQKNTFAFAQGDKAFVSQHIGDMEDADVSDAWFESKGRFEKLFGVRPQMLACDAHPEYLASKWARAQARLDGLPLFEVQHHHAHIASVLGEHGLFGPAIGIAFDGTGYGADGAIWGGEALLANQADYERFANLSYVPMPGGAACVRNPLRMAFGVLWSYDLLGHPAAQEALSALGQQAAVCEAMIEGGLNTPYTSSMGRLFDAVSALLGICTQPSYEGEPAILLDAERAAFMRECPDAAAAVGEDARARYAFAITKNAATESSTAHDTSVVLIDAEPTVRALLDDRAAGVDAGLISLRFHDAVVGAVVQVCELVRAMYDIRLVALSGGVFMNRFVVEEATARLGRAGFTVALNGNLPPNDGCISYGQAVAALASR